MAIEKEIKLDNDVTVKYIIISSYTVDVLNSKICITLDGFKSKSFYNQATKIGRLVAQQQELMKELDSIDDLEEQTKISNKVNKIADEIDSLDSNYNSYVLHRFVVLLDLMEDISVENLENEIITQDLLNKSV